MRRALGGWTTGVVPGIVDAVDHEERLRFARSVRQSPQRQYGVLLSCAPFDEATGDREVRELPARTLVEASYLAFDIARPGGLEHQVMMRSEPGDRWRSQRGESISEVIARRWA